MRSALAFTQEAHFDYKNKDLHAMTFGEARALVVVQFKSAERVQC